MEKIYHLPSGYIRKNQYISFFNKLKTCGQELISWYVGPETGRIIGLYWNTDKEEKEIVMLRACRQKGGLLEHIESDYGWIRWQDALDCMKKSPEVYCTEHMAYFTGISNIPSQEDKKVSKNKIIYFPREITA